MNASPVSANTMNADTADTNVSPSTRTRDASNFDDYLLLAIGIGLVVTLVLLWCVGATPTRWRCFSDVHQAE
jgi:hypothetical protein